MRRGLLFVIAGLVVFAAGGVVAGLGDEPTPSAVAIATAEPTERPTPRPTARPTVRPTPRPTPVPRLSGTYLAYLNHVTASADVILPIMEDVLAGSEAANASGSFTPLFDPSLAMLTWAAEEQGWLLANPPDACYAETFGHWSASVDSYYDAADLITDAVIYDDIGLMLDGTQALIRGNGQLELATAAMSRVICL